jgi:hypothetical protein
LIQTIKVIDVAPNSSSSMDIIVPSSFSPAWKHADINVITFVAPLNARFTDAGPFIDRSWKLVEAHLISSLIQTSNLDEAVRVRLKQP